MGGGLFPSLQGIVGKAARTTTGLSGTLDSPPIATPGI